MTQLVDENRDPDNRNPKHKERDSCLSQAHSEDGNEQEAWANAHLKAEQVEFEHHIVSTRSEPCLRTFRIRVRDEAGSLAFEGPRGPETRAP